MPGIIASDIICFKGFCFDVCKWSLSNNVLVKMRAFSKRGHAQTQVVFLGCWEHSILFGESL